MQTKKRLTILLEKFFDDTKEQALERTMKLKGITKEQLNEYEIIFSGRENAFSEDKKREAK
jgi:hypothetical protein